jgi:hypothetical protein
MALFRVSEAGGVVCLFPGRETRILADSFFMKHPLIVPGKQINPVNVMERDTGQSHHLYEPNSYCSHADPITDTDVMCTAGYPFVINDILTTIFGSE